MPPAPLNFYHQTRFGGIDAPPDEQGDCWATAVCILAGLSPHHRDMLNSRVVSVRKSWWSATRDFLRSRGSDCGWSAAAPTAEEAGAFPFVIATGKSPRSTFNHCVIVDSSTGAMLFDPHPEGTGLDGPVLDYVFVLPIQDK